jgi:NACalpha-BTF3-like transcription factor
MSEYQESGIQSTTGTPRWIGIAVVVLGALSLVGIGVGWTALSHANGVEQTTQASLKQQNDAMSQRLAQAEQQNQQLESDLKVVTDKLNVTQSDLTSARKASKSSAVAYNKKLNGLQDSMTTQLATKASNDDLNKLNGDVSGVKTDLDATKNNLQMATSSMGTLIAKNHDEIDELRRLGQRDYYEFTVNRKAGPKTVAGIQLVLKNTNVKRNRYTISVLADDKNFEKKDRSVNEPIFFYTAGSRAAMELTVNSVSKNSASGYISVPKSARTASASSSGSGN